MKTVDLIADLRSRINPAYANQLGTESYERKLCADAIEALESERDSLAHHLNRQKQWKDAMRDKMLALEAEVERLKNALHDKTYDFDGIVIQRNQARKERDALQARLAAAQGQTKTRAEECRGYALLGTGQYCIKHTLDFDHELGAELLITLATDEDKSGNRQVGESRDDPEPGKPIQPEDMVIRIGFLSERGLFALEDQLAWIRKLHFAATPIPQQAQPEPVTYTPPKIIDPDAPHPCFN